MIIIRIFRLFCRTLLVLFLTSIGLVVLYRFVPVHITPLMLIRYAEQRWNGEQPTIRHTWVPKEKISNHLAMAVIASEDNLFASHHGFDFKQIKAAVAEHKAGKRRRGASTISQQTAKNVFLWPSSDWVRKGLEAYFTVLIELMWSKERIMEVYLNSIEMGKGIYGAEAVARQHFNTSAEKLTRRQSALIAATLPNPLRYNSAKPSAYMEKRQEQILRLMKLVKPFSLTGEKK